MEALEILFTATLWAAAIRIASPLIFATLGELICERAGVLNLGIEGIMTVGAFAGWLTVYHGRRSLARRARGGAGRRGVRAAARLPDRAARPVAACDRHRHHAAWRRSLTYYTYRLVFPEVTSPPKIEPFAPFAIPVLSDIPVARRNLCSGRRRSPISPSSWSRSSPMCSIARRSAWRCAPSARIRRRSRRRASMSRCVRIGAVMAGSALMAIGGAFLTMSAFNSFYFRHGQRARLDLHRARRVRLLAAGQGAARRDAVRGASMPISCDCSSWPARSCPIRCS